MEEAAADAAKAEILASVFHLLTDHTPEVWRKVPAWLRAQIRQAMSDCSVDYRDMSEKNLDLTVEYSE